MKTVKAGCIQPLIAVLCTVLICGVSFSEPLPSSIPSDATYVTIISFSSQAGKAYDSSHCGIFILGETVLAGNMMSSENATESGLLALMIRLMALSGDLNGDRRVDFRDLFLLQLFWERILQEDPYYASGDFDRNGIVDYNDVFQFLQYWYQMRHDLDSQFRLGDSDVSGETARVRKPIDTD